MDHVVGKLGDPDFRFPDNFGGVFAEIREVEKSGHIDFRILAPAKHFAEFFLCLGETGPWVVTASMRTIQFIFLL